jgi:hypothetical protein
MVGTFFRTCQEMDKEFFGKEFLIKAANKTVGPLHLYDIGFDIDTAIGTVFSLNCLLDVAKSILRENTKS